MRSMARELSAAPQPVRRRRRGQPKERKVRTLPVLAVRAMELSLVLGYSWDRVKTWRDGDPGFPKPFRALDGKSRPLWLVSQLQTYLEAKHAEQTGAA